MRVQAAVQMNVRESLKTRFLETSNEKAEEIQIMIKEQLVFC